jgi:hypothetical protein
MILNCSINCIGVKYELIEQNKNLKGYHLVPVWFVFGYYLLRVCKGYYLKISEAETKEIISSSEGGKR